MSAQSSSPPSVSWQALSQRLRPFVRSRVTNDADADDVLQDILLHVHRGLPTLRDTTRMTAWMFRIARNAIADHGRSRQRHPLPANAEGQEAASDSDNWDPAIVAASAQSMAIDHVLSTSLSFFVATLPAPYRQAITLTELEGRTQQQGADMLGISLSAMKSRVQRGRAKLRNLLEDCCTIAVDRQGKRVSCEPRPDWTPPPTGLQPDQSVCSAGSETP